MDSSLGYQNLLTVYKQHVAEKDCLFCIIFFLLGKTRIFINGILMYGSTAEEIQ